MSPSSHPWKESPCSTSHPHLLLGVRGTWSFPVETPIPSLWVSSLSAILGERVWSWIQTHFCSKLGSASVTSWVPSTRLKSFSISQHIPFLGMLTTIQHLKVLTIWPPNSLGLCSNQDPVWKAEHTQGIANKGNWTQETGYTHVRRSKSQKELPKYPR